VQTFEEERFLRFMRGVAEHERHRAKGLYVWSRTRGLRPLAGPGVGPDPRPIPNREDALSVIEYIEEAEQGQGLYVLADFAPYVLEYGAPKPELVRRLRELAWAIRSRPVTVIFLGARFPEIPELEKEVKVLDLPLPEEAETGEILDREAERLRANPNATVDLDQNARANLVQALLGLTVTEMENVLAKSAVRDRGFGSNTAPLVLNEKRASDALDRRGYAGDRRDDIWPRRRLRSDQFPWVRASPGSSRIARGAGRRGPTRHPRPAMVASKRSRGESPWERSVALAGAGADGTYIGAAPVARSGQPPQPRPVATTHAWSGLTSGHFSMNSPGPTDGHVFMPLRVSSRSVASYGVTQPAGGAIRRRRSASTR